MMDQFKEQGGFTLFELLLVIIIMSTITMAVAFSAKESIDKVHYETTKKIAKNIDEALASYAFKAARLPCPADPAVLPGNALYGRESRDAATGQCSGSAVVTPLRTTGFSTTLTGGQNRVLIGRLPSYVEFPVGSGRFVPLNGPPFVKPIDRIGNNLFLDPSGQLPRYAVTRRLAEVGQSGDYGNITLRDGSGANVSGVNDDARYVVVLQSYAQAGCTNTRPVDFENCDGDDSIFNMAKRSTGTDGRYFDDVVLFNNTIFDNRWLTAFAESNNAALYTAPTIRNIGIQTTVPQEKIHVGGVLRADSNVRAPLLCDPPSVVVDTTNQNINFNINIPQEKIVVKRINAAGTTTLVLGTDYTITGSSGAWVVGLTTPPAAGDTTRIEGWQCLDPVTMVKARDVTGSFNSSKSAVLDCSTSQNNGTIVEISTSDMIINAAQVFSGCSSGVAVCRRVYGLGTANHTELGEILDAESSYKNSNGARMSIVAPVASKSGTFWQFRFYRSSFTKPYSLYGFDRPGQMIMLLPDDQTVLDANGITAGNPLSIDNQCIYEIQGSRAHWRYRRIVDGTNPTDRCDGIAVASSPERACPGFHLGDVCGSSCPYNEDMHTILVRPISRVGSAAPCTPVAQATVNFRIVRLDQSLKGIAIDAKGVMQPVCEPIQIRNTVGATVDCGSRTIRGIYTDGNVLCN